MIEIKNVTKTYGKKQNLFTALDDVSFQLPEGSSLAIIGKSGSGKSTLMHVMSGLDRPQRGEVVVEGQNILGLKQKAVDKFRSRSIGFIFQSFFVQGTETVTDNVMLPLEIGNSPLGGRKQLVATALERVELSDKANSRAKDLSGGQKQRLAIARAIVNKPEILFADEPTGNLDSATGEAIENLLFELNKSGVTLIIVTHDEELAGKCQMQLYLKDGKIVKKTGKWSDKS